MNNYTFLLKTRPLLSCAFIVLLLASCTKKDWSITERSEVICQASSNEVTIAGNPFVMDKIELNISSFQLTGERIQSNPIDLTLSPTLETNFLNSLATHNFDIPIGTYTEMQFHSKLESNGNSSIVISGTYYFPNNNTYEIEINLYVNKDINTVLTDTDGSTTVLIEEGAQKQLFVELNVDILFSDLNPGLWNAAAVTSNNGSNTIVVDEMNNTNIYNALSGKVDESLIVRFQ